MLSLFAPLKEFALGARLKRSGAQMACAAGTVSAARKLERARGRPAVDGLSLTVAVAAATHDANAIVLAAAAFAMSVVRSIDRQPGLSRVSMMCANRVCANRDGLCSARFT
jgi:hypothetical protein